MKETILPITKLKIEKNKITKLNGSMNKNSIIEKDNRNYGFDFNYQKNNHILIQNAKRIFVPKKIICIYLELNDEFDKQKLLIIKKLIKKNDTYTDITKNKNGVKIWFNAQKDIFDFLKESGIKNKYNDSSSKNSMQIFTDFGFTSIFNSKLKNTKKIENIDKFIKEMNYIPKTKLLNLIKTFGIIMDCYIDDPVTFKTKQIKANASNEDKDWEIAKTINKEIEMFLDGDDIFSYEYLLKSGLIYWFKFYEKDYLWEKTITSYWPDTLKIWNIDNYFNNSILKQKLYEFSKGKVKNKNKSVEAILAIFSHYRIYFKSRNLEKTFFRLYDLENNKLVSSDGTKYSFDFKFEELIQFFLEKAINDIFLKTFKSLSATWIKKHIFLHISRYGKFSKNYSHIIDFKNGYYDLKLNKFNNFNKNSCFPTNWSFPFEFKKPAKQNKKVDELFLTFRNLFYGKKKYSQAFFHSLLNPIVKNNVGFWFYSDLNFGKSTLFNKLKDLFGYYFTTGDFQNLSNESKKLKQVGKLIVFDDDASKTTQFSAKNIPLIKKELNGQTLRVDVKFKDSIEITPCWTWICLANDTLKTSDISIGDGTIDRVVHIKCEKEDIQLFDWRNVAFTDKDRQYFILKIMEWISNNPSIDYRSIFRDMNKSFDNQKEFRISNSTVEYFKNFILTSQYLLMSVPNKKDLQREFRNTFKNELFMDGDVVYCEIKIELMILLYNSIKHSQRLYDYGSYKLEQIIKKIFNDDLFSISKDEQSILIEKEQADKLFPWVNFVFSEDDDE